MSPTSWTIIRIDSDPVCTKNDICKVLDTVLTWVWAFTVHFGNAAAHGPEAHMLRMKGYFFILRRLLQPSPAVLTDMSQAKRRVTRLTCTNETPE